MPTGVYIRTKPNGTLGKHWKLSEETRKRQSEASKRRVFSEERRMKMSLCRIGIKLSDSHRRHIAEGNTGRKVSLETRLKMSATLKSRREQSKCWKGGVTPLNKVIRFSVEYQLWRESVFKRDGHTCQELECGQVGGRLNAHHIKPFATHPNLRFVVDNGMTLCENCHRKKHLSLKLNNMSDVSPSEPKMNGNSEVVHDNLSDADHEAQLHGNSQKDSAEGEDKGNAKEDGE